MGGPIPLVYFGKPGSYTHQAALAFGETHGFEFDLIPAPTFRRVFETVVELKQPGIVPVRNSTAGIVYEALDLIVEEDLRIVGEHFLPIKLSLVGWPKDGEGLEGRTVHSHPKALSQSGNFIAENGLQAMLAPDTASAVEYVAKLVGDEKYEHLAIGSAQAAERYGVPVLRENVHDNPTNTTGFKVIRPSGIKTPIEDLLMSGGWLKASVIYDVGPNSLGRVLEIVKKARYWTGTTVERPAQWEGDEQRIFNLSYYSEIGIPKMRGGEGKRIELGELFEQIEREVGCKIRVLGIYPRKNPSEAAGVPSAPRKPRR